MTDYIEEIDKYRDAIDYLRPMVANIHSHDPLTHTIPCTIRMARYGCECRCGHDAAMELLRLNGEGE